MHIYFAGAISGGRENLSVYRHIVARLKSLGHSIPTGHVADPLVLERERSLNDQAIYQRDVTWICESRAMVAEVSTPSLGVGYEICCALGHDKPVLCLYRKGLVISKLITGNTSHGIRIAPYQDAAELDRLLDEFLAFVESAAASLST